MIRALAIIGAIISAWISGAGIPDHPKRRHLIGSSVSLLFALIFGALAWWW